MANAVWTAMAAAYIHGNGSCRTPESTDNRACGGLIKQKKIVPYLTDLLAILVRLAIPCVRHPCEGRLRRLCVRWFGAMHEAMHEAIQW